MAGRVTKRSRIPRYLDDAERKVELGVAKAAAEILATVAQRSRVRTGRMKSAWRIEAVGSRLHVVNPVEHVFYNEFGTEHMRAQPMLSPGIERADGPFEEAVRDAYEL